MNFDFEIQELTVYMVGIIMAWKDNLLKAFFL